MNELVSISSLPIPLIRPHICGQCVMYSNVFSFFGGSLNEISLSKHKEINDGTIYSFSALKPDQIYESDLETPYRHIIASSTVFNEEIGMSFTFGGLSVSYDEKTQSIEKTTVSSIYAYRWISSNEVFHTPLSHHSSKKLTIDNFFNPIDDAFDIEEGFSGIFNLQKSNQMFTPNLTSQKPSPRCFHSAAWDQKNNLMWIFGGLTITNDGNKEYLNDLWVWSLYTGMWYKVYTQNPPKPRIGSSMTYLNGKIYLFGGYSPYYSKDIYQDSNTINTNKYLSTDDIEDYYFYSLDISNVILNQTNLSEHEIDKFSDLSWDPITNVPSRLQRRLFGATILPYEPSDFQSFVIFSGGSLANKYGSVTKLSKKHRIVTDLEPMSIVSYDPQSGEFQVHAVLDSVPEVSYHSAGVSKDGVLHVAGGICSSAGGEEYSVHNQLHTVDLSRLFSFPASACGWDGQSIVVSSCSLPDSAACKSIERRYYADFVQAVADEVQAAGRKERTQALLAAFERHQEEHAPIEKFVATCDGLYASKFVLERRIGQPFLPRVHVPHYMLRDLFMFAYADVIDLSKRPDHVDALAFCSFIEFCRTHRLLRLIALEVASHISVLTARQFLSVCVSTSGGFDGKPLFADPGLSFMRTLFARVVPRYHQHIDFRAIGSIEPSLAKFIMSEIHGAFEERRATARTVKHPATIDGLFAMSQSEPAFQIPEATVYSDLACFAPDSSVQSLDGPFGSDSSSLQFPPERLANTKYNVIAAVKTFQFKPLFDTGDVDDIYDAFSLLCECLTPIDGRLLSKVLSDSRHLFLSFAASNREFKTKLARLACTIESEDVLEFALTMVGVNGQTVVIDRESRRLLYDSALGSPLQQETITIPVGRTTILAIFILMYNYSSINSAADGRADIQKFLPTFIGRRKLAEEMLTVCACSFLVSPCWLRQAVGEFIIDQMFRPGCVTDEAFLEHFPRLFDANLHEEAAKRMYSKSGQEKKRRKDEEKIEFARLARTATEQQRYINGLSEEQLIWLIEKAKCSSKADNLYISDDSDSFEESNNDDITSFSK